MGVIFREERVELASHEPVNADALGSWLASLSPGADLCAQVHEDHNGDQYVVLVARHLEDWDRER